MGPQPTPGEEVVHDDHTRERITELVATIDENTWVVQTTVRMYRVVRLEALDQGMRRAFTPKI